MTPSASFQIRNNRICFTGELIISQVNSLMNNAQQVINELDVSHFILDFKEISHIDTAGVAFIEILQRKIQESGNTCDIENIPRDIEKTRVLFSLKKKDRVDIQRAGFSPFEALGNFLYLIGHTIHDFFYLIADTFYYAAVGLIKKHGIRRGEFVNQSILIGMNSLPIIALISFLIGLILALQSAAQLRQFGAAIFVADLIAIAMTREMGPIMTAIVLAGRSGSSITSEIATMVVTEETDALKSMALNPIQYVLVPKFYAITITMPLLTMLSMIIGILGAFIIGITYLDIGIEPFYNQVVNALVFRDIYTGLIKSFVFAWIIVIISAFYGFRVRGGSEEVGKATTGSVVASIFFIILADCILGLIFYFGQPIII